MRPALFRLFTGCVLVTSAIPLLALGDDLSGRYQCPEFSVTLASREKGYTGDIHLGEQTLPLEMHADGNHWAGAFSSQGSKFDFTASFESGTMTLVTDGKTHVLKKVPANPPANVPHAPEAKAKDKIPGGYELVNATDFGKTVTVVKTDVATVQKALELTIPDLTTFFGARPKILGAYEDSKSHTGGAWFTAALNGQAIRGFISCQLTDKGAKLAVIYCRADAPQAEWDKLAAAPVAGEAAPAAPIPLREYQFPDGTGSVGLAQGWTTNAQTCMTCVEITGPADQNVYLGLAFSVVTPTSTAVRMQQQLEMQARQWGMRPPPPLQLLVAPMTGPVEAIENLIPQLSRMSQASGGPALRLDRIVKQEPGKAVLPGGRAALVTFDVTRTTNGVAKKYRAMAQVELDAISNESFLLYLVEGAAPVETFDKDLPAMVAMAMSWKTNDAVVQAKTAEAIDAQNRRFAAQQAAHREVMEAFDRYNRAWERRQIVQERSFADFDEVIRGYRTVEDTRTGWRTSVDLGNAHDIVEKLNERDPGRYREIPLRDEVAPLR